MDITNLRSPSIFIKGGHPLVGTVSVPGDKSITHRALILGTLAIGENNIRGWLDAGDTRATLNILQELGIEFDITKDEIKFLGKKLNSPVNTLDCRNSGTSMRLLAGLLASQLFSSILDGSPQLRQRPMSRVVNPLNGMGANIESDGGKAPLKISPAKIKGSHNTSPIASAQVKSAVLIAGWFAEDKTSIQEPVQSRDHTERMMAEMGAPIETKDLTVLLGSQKESLKPLDLEIPGDFSSAAFLIIAGLINPGSDITIKNVGLNPTRTGLIEILSRMGAKIKMTNYIENSNEPRGEITVKASQLMGTIIRGDEIARTIDELPILAVAATQAIGETVIKDAGELRVKEVDRISVLVKSLKQIGAKIEETPDGMIIQGPTKLIGAPLPNSGDHRIEMAMAIAGLVSEGSLSLENPDTIGDSFPGFTDLLDDLGADISMSMRKAEITG